MKNTVEFKVVTKVLNERLIDLQKQYNQMPLGEPRVMVFGRITELVMTLELLEL